MTFYAAKWYLSFPVISGTGVEIEQAPGGVKLHPRRSQEIRGRPELQAGGLRALEDAWMTTFRVRHSPCHLLAFLVLLARLAALPRAGGALEQVGGEKQPWDVQNCTAKMIGCFPWMAGFWMLQV